MHILSRQQKPKEKKKDQMQQNNTSKALAYPCLNL